MHVDTITYKGRNIEVYYDDDVYYTNPRQHDYSVVSNLISISDRTFWDDLGPNIVPSADMGKYYTDRELITALEGWVRIFAKGVCREFWTSGNGTYFAYVDGETIQKEWDGDKEKAQNYLNGEVEDFKNWAEGYVYRYRVEGGEDYDSWEAMSNVGGFLGFDYEENGLLDCAREFIDVLVEEEEALEAEVEEMRLIEIGA